jgi:hypothetical protein
MRSTTYIRIMDSAFVGVIVAVVLGVVAAATESDAWGWACLIVSVVSLTTIWVVDARYASRRRY